MKFMKICEKCGATYDSWDGHCDCEDTEELTERGKEYDISKCEPRSRNGFREGENGRVYEQCLLF